MIVALTDGCDNVSLPTHPIRLVRRLAEQSDNLTVFPIGVNVRGPFATIRALRALLEADGGGVVVNVSSLAARMAGGSNVAYCASKAAVENMTMSLARALAPVRR